MAAHATPFGRCGQVPYGAMAVSASLSVARVDVAPGSRATAKLTLRNTGSVVDEFRIEILGPAAAFTTASPETVPLFPGAEATVELTFAPLLDSKTATGEIDVAVKVTSKEDPDGSAVEELVVYVGGFSDAFAELVPRTIRGARSAKTELAIDNRGNARIEASATGLEADGALRFEIEPPGFGVDPGAANFARVEVRPNKRFLRGPDRTYPFKVVSETKGSGTLTADGMFVQRAILPHWLVRALLALLLALIALALLWQFAFKPVVRSAAKNAAKADVSQAAVDAAKLAVAAVDNGKGSGARAGAGAGGDTTAAGSGPGSGSPSDTTGAGASAGAGGDGTGDDGRGGTSTAKRIEVEVASNETKSGDWTPAEDKAKQFNLTDIVLQNPKGDTGLLRVKRGGDILLESALENFRDLDFHFVAPYVYKSGEKLTIEIVCKNPDTAGNCKAAATLTGFLKAAAPS